MSDHEWSDDQSDWGDFHVWYRGHTKNLGQMSAISALKETAKFLGDCEAGDTDDDPVYLFKDYVVTTTFKPAAAYEGVNSGLSIKVFNVFTITEHWGTTWISQNGEIGFDQD
jgi:hypothetical protein